MSRFSVYFHALEAGILGHRYALGMAAFALMAIVAVVWALASRKHKFVLQHSDESDALMLQLGRIAAALETLTARDEVPNFTSDQILREPPPEPEQILREVPAEPAASVETIESPPPLTRVGVGSMFSFTRRPELPNPFHRFKA